MNERFRFYGYEPHWLTPDKLWLLVLQSSTLAGARVGGQIWRARPPSEPTVVQGDEIAKEDLLRRYEDPFLRPETVPDLDPKNFAWNPGDVDHIAVRTRPSWWTGAMRVVDSGTLDVHLYMGRRRRLILIGNQDRVDIVRRIRAAGFAIDDAS